METNKKEQITDEMLAQLTGALENIDYSEQDVPKKTGASGSGKKTTKKKKKKKKKKGGKGWIILIVVCLLVQLWLAQKP